MAALATMIVALAAGGGLAGIALLAIGLRGRRIDDHPVCRGCGFDLVGVYPGVAVCPECGGVLNQQTVRIGQRRRRVRMAVCGGVLLALTVSVGAIVGVKTAQGLDWNPYKPTFLLVAQAGAGSGPVTDELIARAEKGRLRSSHAVSILRRLSGRSWSSASDARLVVAMWEHGLVSDEDAVALLRAAGPPQVQLSRQGYTGGAIYRMIASVPAPARGISAALTLDFTLVATELNDRPLELSEGLTMSTAPRDYTSPASAWDGITSSLRVQLPIADRTAGTVRMRWRASAISGAGARAGEVLATWDVTLESEVPGADEPGPQ